MFEAIIYNINKTWSVVIIFLIFSLVFGLSLYILTRKFDIKKKSSRIGGLIAGFSNRQIILFTSVILRTFLLYTALIYTRNIFMLLCMILIVDLIYIIANPKKLLFESINIIGQVVFLYLNYLLTQYRLEFGTQMYVLQVQVGLNIFIIFYIAYFFIKNIEEVINKRPKKKITRMEKSDGKIEEN